MPVTHVGSLARSRRREIRLTLETRRAETLTQQSDERDAIEETRFGAAQEVFVMEEGSSPSRARAFGVVAKIRL